MRRADEATPRGHPRRVAGETPSPSPAQSSADPRSLPSTPRRVSPRPPSPSFTRPPRAAWDHPLARREARAVRRGASHPHPHPARAAWDPHRWRARAAASRARAVWRRAPPRAFSFCCVCCVCCLPVGEVSCICLFASFRFDCAARHACVFARRARACVLMAAPRRARARASLDVVCFARAALGRGRGAGAGGARHTPHVRARQPTGARLYRAGGGEEGRGR